MKTVVTLAVLSLAAQANAQPSEKALRSGRTLSPTADEAATLRTLAALDRNRPRGGPSGEPVIGADKSVRFVFGASLPVIVCAPLQVCDVELQPGEKIRSVQVGDSVRWAVEPAVAGTAPREIQHVIIKPADVALRTSLVVTTDRRTYRMKLLSDADKYMASVSFAYPLDAQARWTQLARARPPGSGSLERKSRRRPSRRSGHRQRGIMDGGHLSAMSFDYEMQGDEPPWKPVRVYNDGLQTVIEMPYAMRQTEAPTLLVVRAEGGLFSDDDVVQVNFHTQSGDGGTKYLVDMVFDVADLIVGVGSTQQKVRIRRR